MLFLIASVLDYKSILQKLEPFVTELNTHLTEKSEKLKKNLEKGGQLRIQLLLYVGGSA